MIINLPTKAIYATSDRQIFLRVLPTRWRRKPVGIDMERNYVTVTLCIINIITWTTLKKVCVQLPTSADNVTLLALLLNGRRCPSTSPARRAHSSKPAARCCSGQQMGQTDGRTDKPCRRLYINLYSDKPQLQKQEIFKKTKEKERHTTCRMHTTYARRKCKTT